MRTPPESSRVFFNLMLGDTVAAKHLYLVEDVATKATSLIEITEYDERRHRMVAGTAVGDGCIAVIRVPVTSIQEDDDGAWEKPPTPGCLIVPSV